MNENMERIIAILAFASAYGFYVAVRWYLNKYKGYNLPLMFERYHDDLKRTYMQLLIFGTAVIINLTVAILIMYKLAR